MIKPHDKGYEKRHPSEVERSNARIFIIENIKFTLSHCMKGGFTPGIGQLEQNKKHLSYRHANSHNHQVLIHFMI